MTAYERSGWRDPDLVAKHAQWGERLCKQDMAISERHRGWGRDVPIVDIDWLVIEYDHRKPVAIIDYQNARGTAAKTREEDPNIDAFAKMAEETQGEGGGVAAFVVRYRHPPWEFYVKGLENLANGLLPTARRMGEEEYVRWIYSLRGRTPPAEIIEVIRRAA